MLTEREMEILLIAKGYSNQEIASASHITIKTVKTHVSNILSKLEYKIEHKLLSMLSNTILYNKITKIKGESHGETCPSPFSGLF